jgi:AraC-like DNA-binding protein
MPNEPYNPAVRLLLCHATRLDDWDLPDLSAPHWRLYWNDKAGAEVVWKGQTTRLTPDKLVLISPDTAYAAKARTPAGHLFIHFLVGGQFGTMAPGIFTVPASKNLQDQARRLLKLAFEAENISLPRQLAAYSLIYTCLALLPAASIPPAITDPRITRVLDRLNQAGAPVSNRVLARLADMNENAFIRLFKLRTGLSPQAYSRNKRVEHACDLLLHSDASIEQVADRAGFSDRYHFSRVFSEVRGISPARFRKTAYFHVKNP